MKTFLSQLILASMCVVSFAAETPESDGRPKQPADQRQLIALLQSADASTYDKARACQQLSTIGNRDAVPALASLLGDEQLSNYARCGLEGIADKSAGDALCAGLVKLHGKLLIGVVNSIGVRRDVQAVPTLIGLAKNPASGAAAEALLTLGRIATPDAEDVLKQTLANGPAELRPAAAEACLLAADRELVSGKRKVAIVLYDLVRAADVSQTWRAVAMHGAILSRRSEGLPLLIEQLRSGDPVMVNVALRSARELTDRSLTRSLLAELNTAKPTVQELLIPVLVDRGDVSALKPIETLASSENGDVRQAALRALGTFGADSSVPVLLSMASSLNESDSSLALNSLSQIKAKDTDVKIIEKLPTVSPAVRAKLVAVLGDRNAMATVGDLIKFSNDPDADASSSVFRVLGMLAMPADLPKLIPAALATPEGAVREQAERAVFLTSLKVASEQRAELPLKVLSSASSTSNKASLIRILGSVGTAPACVAVKAALKDSDDAVRETAFRTLVDWPNGTAMTTVIELIGSDPSSVHHVLALRGALRVAGREQASPEAVGWFKQLTQVVRTPDEKKQVIFGLVQLCTDHVESLQLLQQYLDDPALQADAAQTLVQNASTIIRKKPSDQLKTTLEKISSTAADTALRKKAAGLARSVEAKLKK